MLRCIYRGPRGGISGPKRGGVVLPYTLVQWLRLKFWMAQPFYYSAQFQRQSLGAPRCLSSESSPVFCVIAMFERYAVLYEEGGSTAVEISEMLPGTAFYETFSYNLTSRISLLKATLS